MAARCSLVVLLVFTSLGLAQEEDYSRDEQTLRDAQMTWDVPALLTYFRSRSVEGVSEQQIRELIRQTGHESFRVRKEAAKSLESMGLSALSLLRASQADPNPEIARRCQVLCQQLETVPSGLLAASCVRLLVRARPPEAAAVLLRFLPHADDEMASDAVRQALPDLVLRDGRTNPVFLQAAQDASPIRRGAVGEALVRTGASPEVVADLRRDRDPAVRLRVCLALVAHAKDKSAVPEIITLLGATDSDQASRGEIVLLRLAGDDAPPVSLLGDELAKKKWLDTWMDWWNKKGKALDLAKVSFEQRFYGYTLVVKTDLTGQNGRVIEYAPDNKRIRWQITGLQLPVYAQVLPNQQRVLIAEQNAGMVVERDFQGRVYWKYEVNSPISCERLVNGHTVIVSRGQLIELNAKNEPVFRLNRPGDIVAGRKASDGGYVFATQNGRVTRLDSRGKEVRSFQAGRMYHFSSLQLLPQNRILITHFTGVAEFDELTGNQVWWSASIRLPSSVCRLPSGNTLVSSPSMRKLQELDRSGKVVHEERLQDEVPYAISRR